jgi:hypothetical protein
VSLIVQVKVQLRPTLRHVIRLSRLDARAEVQLLYPCRAGRMGRGVSGRAPKRRDPLEGNHSIAGVSLALPPASILVVMLCFAHTSRMAPLWWAIGAANTAAPGSYNNAVGLGGLADWRIKFGPFATRTHDLPRVSSFIASLSAGCPCPCPSPCPSPSSPYAGPSLPCVDTADPGSTADAQGIVEKLGQQAV